MTEIGVQLPEIGVQLRPKPVFNFARNRCSTSSEKPIGGEIRVMSAEIVEPNYFDTMGSRPVHGRAFEAVETAAVAVISNAVWLSEFGGDPSVLGRAITINGSPFTVVGVAPVELASAQGIFRVDVRLPLAFKQLVRPDDVGRQE